MNDKIRIIRVVGLSCILMRINEPEAEQNVRWQHMLPICQVQRPVSPGVRIWNRSKGLSKVLGGTIFFFKTGMLTPRYSRSAKLKYYSAFHTFLHIS